MSALGWSPAAPPVADSASHFYDFLTAERHQSLFRLAFIAAAMLLGAIVAVVAQKPLLRSVWIAMVSSVVVSTIVVLSMQAFVFPHTQSWAAAARQTD